MNTTLTPPTAPASEGAPPPAPRRASAQVIAILAIVFGGLLAFGTIAVTTLSIVRSGTTHTERFTADVAGLTGLDVDVSGADLTVVYDATVDEATLAVTDVSTTRWRLTRDGDDLAVSTRRAWWSGWGGSDEIAQATLTLPDRLSDAGLDASFDLSAGSIAAAGSYDELELDLSAGSLSVDGSARELDVSVSAGEADLDLADLRRAELDVSAGDVQGRLTGTPPRELVVEASAGKIELAVPDAAYVVDSEVSLGDFTHELTTDPASTNHVSVQVSAGSVHLFPGR
ncbi:hypothetical protein [Microbacterium sp.]|uniref:hypothetical protein n=1 Tax=Microbacterium sp. TaxID=51671 RepID=UPI0039E3CDE5